MANATSTQPQKSSSGSALIFFLPPFFVIGSLIFAFFIGTGTFTTNGATKDTYHINPAPNSPAQNLLGDLARYQDPKAFINKNQSDFSAIATMLTELNNKIAANDPSVKSIPATSKEKVKAQIVTLQTDLQNIQKDASASQALTKDAAQFSTDLKMLDQLTTSAAANGQIGSALADLAQKVATYNDEGNHNKIPYIFGSGHPIKLSTQQLKDTKYVLPEGGLDCSGFISYLLLETGVLKSPAQASLSTDSYIAAAKNGTYGLSFVPGYEYDGHYYDLKTMLSNLESGAKNPILPGDIIVMNSGQSPSGKHIGIYVGGDGNKNFVHSRGTKAGGPQFSRMSWRNDVIAIIRVQSATTIR